MNFDRTHPILYLITDGTATDGTLPESIRRIRKLVRRSAERQVGLVQLREKNLSARSLYHLALEAVAAKSGTETLLLINDRADVAVAAGADGVHLTSLSIPIEAVRRTVPNGFLIGASTHSLPEVKLAYRAGADFAVYGPVFDTPGKGESKGVDDLADVCRQTGGFPVIALGGVHAGNFDEVIAAGAGGAAAIRWLNDYAAVRA